MRYFKRVLELVGKHRKLFITGLVLAFLKDFSFIFIFAALHYAFSHIQAWNTSVALHCLWIMAGGILYHFLFRYLQDRLVSAEGYEMFKNYRLRAGEKLKKAPMGYFNDQRLGNIQGALTSTISVLENYTVMLLTDIINGFGIAIILTVGFFSFHLYLGLLMIPVLILAAIVLYRLYKVAMNHVPLQHEIEQRMNFAVIDMIRGMSVLKIFPMDNQKIYKDTVQQKANRIYEEKKEEDIHCEVDYAWRAKLYGFLLSASSVCLMLLTAKLYMAGQINMAESLTMAVGAYMIFLGLGPLSDGAFLYVKVPSNQTYIDQVLNIPAIPDGEIKKVQGPFNLAFENVRFQYDAKREIIKDISFEIKEGQKVAIVGPSGSGKTTLVNLMARFWDVNDGKITLGGEDIRNYPTELLLKQLSMVFQDVYLFNDSIINNVRFAKPEATDEEIMAVCQQARCHEFIMEQKDGYATIVGEGGANLSGGEKQRISIARALLKDAPIILLDEATSSVDPENEAEILAAIDELCKGKTVISIAHRLSTVENADQILVVDDGQLKERGTHNELLSKGGIYASFVDARTKAKGWRISNS